MSDHQPRLLVTAASGQLGRLVVDRLLATVPAASIVATVRNAEAGAPLAALGVELRIADYAKPETLAAAFAGIDRLLLISSNAVGQRVGQHRNAIDAAKRAGVGLVVYTSVLHADVSKLGLAGDHRETEALLRASGLPFVVLRNGWYTENHTASVPSALAHGAMMGSAGAGRIAAAARADYAAAAAAVLTATDVTAGRTYELAGDAAFTLPELAAEVARQSGQPIAYHDLPEAGFKAALLQAGLPQEIAELLADSDAAAADGALFDDGRELSTLIGRATTPMAATVTEALRQR